MTGASAGIGKAAARELARAGARVSWLARNVAACREAKLREELAALPAALPDGPVIPIDLADLASVRHAADAIRSRPVPYPPSPPQLPLSAPVRLSGTRLDCLILNAGYHGPKRLTKDGFEMTLAVNHLGHM